MKGKLILCDAYFRQQMAAKAEEFLTLSDMPNVIGLIDGTHVGVRKPAGEDGRLFINRKGNASLNVQVII